MSHASTSPTALPALSLSALRTPFDPRWGQIAVLSALSLYGFVGLKFGVTPPQAALTIAVALLTQWVCTWWARLPVFDPKSALISGLSLCLLLRSNSMEIVAAAAVIAVGSKFVLRVRGKHIFNPTNFALTMLMLWTNGEVWVSPGQWGNAAFFGFLLACLGSMVVNRAARSDVTVAFLVSYLALVFGRSYWLGEPMTIPFHRLQSGGLILFAFFMISDPKTTPDTRVGRIFFAALVAFVGWYIQFRLFRTNGLLWSLVGCSGLVPLIDLLLPGRRYVWPGTVPAQPAPQFYPPQHAGLESPLLAP
jgi:Na+-transporting NADH:ubiquinone oxidoreductase subunit NqrB